MAGPPLHCTRKRARSARAGRDAPIRQYSADFACRYEAPSAANAQRRSRGGGVDRPPQVAIPGADRTTASNDRGPGRRGAFWGWRSCRWFPRGASESARGVDILLLRPVLLACPNERRGPRARATSRAPPRGRMGLCVPRMLRWWAGIDPGATCWGLRLDRHIQTRVTHQQAADCDSGKPSRQDRTSRTATHRSEA